MGIGLVIKHLALVGLTSAGLAFGGLNGVHHGLAHKHPAHPVNHGLVVSSIAKGHGVVVSAIAKSTSVNHGTVVRAAAKSHGKTVSTVAKTKI